MNEGALSRDAMLASLQDIRLPADAAGGQLAEIAVSIGLAALLAGLSLALLRLFSRHRSEPRPPSLAARLEYLRTGTTTLPVAGIHWSGADAVGGTAGCAAGCPD